MIYFDFSSYILSIYGFNILLFGFNILLFICDLFHIIVGAKLKQSMKLIQNFY